MQDLKELENIGESLVSVKESRQVVAALLIKFPDMDIHLIRERSFALINYIGNARVNDFGESINKLNKERIRKVLVKNLLPDFIPHGKGLYSLDFTDVDAQDK